ncbi:MAG: hypothetical protein N2448_06465 [Caloramator sp.]|nr:hypothetical protein [Caloramator sp.]
MKGFNKDVLLLKLEKYLPFIISIFFGIYIFLGKYNPNSINNFKDILSSVINLGAIFIGFLATMISILIALTGKRVIKRIQNNNATELFNSYLFIPIIVGFILVLLSITIIPISNYNNNTSRNFFVLWSFMLVYFLTTSIRIIIILQRIFKEIIKEYEDKISNQQIKVIKPDITKAFGNINNDKK